MFLLTRARAFAIRRATTTIRRTTTTIRTIRRATMPSTPASNERQQQQTVEPLAPTPLATASAALASRELPLPPELSEYRPNVSVLLVNPHTRCVFSAQRVDDPHKTWQCPQGGIDEGESALAAALRELREESAIFSVRVIGATGWLAYDFPDWVRARLRPGMLKYKGQAQRWFCALYLGGVQGDGGSDGCDEVDLSGGGIHAREFDAWAWRELERLPLDVSEFKKGVYERAAREFGALLDELEREGALAAVAAEARAAEEERRRGA
jgi:putative (di)nucleoside polyphosphate hydrolase